MIARARLGNMRIFLTFFSDFAKLTAYMNLPGGTFPEKRPGGGDGTPERKNPLKSRSTWRKTDIQGVIKQALACKGL